VQAVGGIDQAVSLAQGVQGFQMTDFKHCWPHEENL
jgi:hypothetical protein